MPVAVVLQHRQRLLREGLSDLLHGHPDINVAGSTAAPRGLADLCAEVRPDVVVLEADANEWDPCRLADRVRRGAPSTRFVGTYASLAENDVNRLPNGSLNGLVSLSAGVGPLVQAIRQEQSNGWPVHALTALPTPRVTLTPREKSVLTLVGMGCSALEISGLLGISRKTVEHHKQRMYRKLRVSSQAHALAVALRSGLISPGQALEGSAGGVGRPTTSMEAGPGGRGGTVRPLGPNTMVFPPSVPERRDAERSPA